MSVFGLKDFLRAGTGLYTQVRFGRNRPNIQRPKPPHFLKNKFLTVTKHKEPEDFRPPVEKCLKPLEKIPPYELDALDKIYASELRELFKQSKLSAVFAKTSTKFDELHQAKILFFKANMKVVERNKYIVREAIGDTEFRHLLPLFNARHFMIFSPEADISSLVKINEKLPKFDLLCGVAYGRILSVSQLQSLGALGGIDDTRSRFVQTLQSGPQSVVRSLQSHQNTLVQQLQQRMEQLQPSAKEEENKQ